MALLDDFRIKFPELAGVSDARVNDAIGEAYSELSIDVFEEKHDLAVLYMAAHLVTYSSTAAAQGVQSVTAGQASVSYFTGAQIATWPTTSYGKRLLQLSRQHVGMMVL